MISRKHKKVFITLTYIKHVLILLSTIIGCISLSTFASWLGFPIRITSSAIGFKICSTVGGIKKYKTIIKEKKEA